jgi:hypothetical protein
MCNPLAPEQERGFARSERIIRIVHTNVLVYKRGESPYRASKIIQHTIDVHTPMYQGGRGGGGIHHRLQTAMWIKTHRASMMTKHTIDIHTPMYDR